MISSSDHLSCSKNKPQYLILNQLLDNTDRKHCGGLKKNKHIHKHYYVEKIKYIYIYRIN